MTVQGSTLQAHNTTGISLPPEISSHLMGFLTKKDVWTLYQSKEIAQFFGMGELHYYVGQWTPKNPFTENERKDIFRKVKMLAYNPKNCKHNIPLPVTFWERLSFLGNGDTTSLKERMNQYKEMFEIIKTHFTPTTPLELRNRNWCLFNLFKFSQDFQKLANKSFEEGCTKLGIVNPVLKWVYKIILWLRKMFFKPQPSIAPITKDDSDRSQFLPLEIGAYQIDQVSHKVILTHSVYALYGEPYEESNLGLTSNPAYFEANSHQNPLYSTVPSHPKIHSLRFSESQYQGDTKDQLHVKLILPGQCDASDGPLRLALVQIAIEIFYRNTFYNRIFFDSSYNHAAILAVSVIKNDEYAAIRMSPNAATLEQLKTEINNSYVHNQSLSMLHTRRLNVLYSVLYHRAGNKDSLFPPYEDYNSITYDLEKRDIENGKAIRIDRDQEIPWEKIIAENPILYGKDPVMPFNNN